MHVMLTTVGLVQIAREELTKNRTDMWSCEANRSQCASRVSLSGP